MQVVLNMSPEEVYEIRVRPVRELSPEAQSEVNEKLLSKPREFVAGYRGFAAVTYVRASPLHVKSVDPIEGEFNNLLAKLMASYHAKPVTPSA